MDTPQAVVVLGDEASCAGFRLAGVAAHCPATADPSADFTRALASSQLVVLTRGVAAALPSGALQRAMARELPLVVVLPDIDAPLADTGLAQRIRAVLGIET
jgi:vacuolar-type H+-ATPase subunit F/Vma7